MALASPPHPVAKFRVLKQAWREYLASGNAVTLAITPLVAQAAANALTVSGTSAVDPAMPNTYQVTVSLLQGAATKGTRIVMTTPGTGAWTTTFPGGTCVAGATQATAQVPYAPSVSSNTVTLT